MSKEFAMVEHIWGPVESVPDNLRGIFPNGACVVFADEVFTAAIPATEFQTEQFNRLLELGNKTGDFEPYFSLRDRLCGEFSYHQLSLLFKQEMERIQIEEERQSRSKYAKLASAARFN